MITDEYCLKRELEKQLKLVKHRLELLDLIEEKLFQMRELAQCVVDKKMCREDMDKIGTEVKSLEQQVNFLNLESTELD